MRGFDFDKALVALQNELHCFAYKLTADKDEAENLLQETMLRTLDNKDKFDSGTNFKGWMYTIMRNMTLSKILCKWKQDSAVSLFLYLNSVFKNKHKLIHNQAPVMNRLCPFLLNLHK